MVEKPRGLLGNVESARNLAATDVVFAVRYQPCGREPLVETERRFLVDRFGLQRELPFRVSAPAFPSILIREKAYILAPAPGAFDTVRPPTSNHVVPAVDRIGEVYDSFLKASWFSFRALLLTIWIA